MFLLPSAVAEAILASQASWGWLSLRHDRVEDLAVVVGYSVKETQRFPMANISTFLREHYSRVIDVVPWSAVWYRAQPDLHTAWLQVIRRGPGVGLPIETVRDWIPTGWRNPGPDRPMPMLTVALIEGRPDWKAWWATSAGVVPAELHLVEEGAALFAPLRPGWPVDLLASLLVTVVGVGSIGSAAADALAAYAIGRLALVDPDRLLLHNLARHRLPREQLGRRKVTAVAGSCGSVSQGSRSSRSRSTSLATPTSCDHCFVEATSSWCASTGSHPAGSPTIWRCGPPHLRSWPACSRTVPSARSSGFGLGRARGACCVTAPSCATTAGSTPNRASIWATGSA